MTRKKVDVAALTREAEKLIAHAKERAGAARDIVHEIAGDLELVLGDSPALAIPIAANRKLAPVEMQVAYRADGTPFSRKRPVPLRPFVSSTYVPVKHTCPGSCPFRGNGCMAEAGYTGLAVKRLEAIADDATHGLSADEAARRIAKAEARAIDSLCVRGVPRDGGRDGQSPRDMRLHVSGDVTSLHGLALLRAAVARWQLRGGGVPWTFTHAWRRYHRALWGSIRVLASVETPDEAEEAWRRGYTPAMTVREFPSRQSFRVDGANITWIPCPAETSGRTCVECRLCLDRTEWMHANRRGIAFAVHGPEAEAAKRKLPVLSASTGA